MTIPRIIAILFWVFAITVAIFGALNLANDANGKSAQTKIPEEAAMLFYLFAFISGLISGFRMSSKSNKITWMDKALDRLFGIGFSEALEKELHIHILLASFFILAGGTGLLKAQITGFSGLELLAFSVFLFSGIGLSFGFLIYWFFRGRKKNA